MSHFCAELPVFSLHRTLQIRRCGADNNQTRETMEMRKMLATAAATAAAGIMAVGLAAAPAQAATTTAHDRCYDVRIFYTDFAALEVAEGVGGRDGLASMADMRAAAAGANGASPLLRKAAARATRSPAWFTYVDVFDQHRSKVDGLISRDDLRKYFNKFCR